MFEFLQTAQQSGDFYRAHPSIITNVVKEFTRSDLIYITMSL